MEPLVPETEQEPESEPTVKDVKVTVEDINVTVEDIVKKYQNNQLITSKQSELPDLSFIRS